MSCLETCFRGPSGAPQEELMAALSAPSFDSTYPVTPVPIYLTFPQGIPSCTALKRRIFLHLDVAHIRPGGEELRRRMDCVATWPLPFLLRAARDRQTF